MDTAFRFCALYLTSLFSLDSYSAAANSPYSLPSTNAQHQPRQRRTDWGEGPTIGRRLDAAGPTRRTGRVGGGEDLNVTPPSNCCGAVPQIHQ